MVEFENTRDFRKRSLIYSTMVWYKINAMWISAPVFILPIQITIHIEKIFDKRANRINQEIYLLWESIND